MKKSLTKYYVVTGTARSIHAINKEPPYDKRDAVGMAEDYLRKHPGKPVMLMAMRRVKVWNRKAVMPKKGMRRRAR